MCTNLNLVGITPSGLGRVIEAYHRTVPTDAILGGGQSIRRSISENFEIS